MRLVHVISTLDSWAGGTSRAVTALADALEDHGVRNCVAHLARRDGAGDLCLPLRAGQARIPARFVGVRPWLAPGFARVVARELGPRGDGLIHAHGLWGLCNLLAERAAHRLGVPMIVSPHGMLDPWALERGRLQKEVALQLFQRRALRAASMFFASSSQEAASIRAAGFVAPIAIVPHPMAPAATTAGHPDRRDRRTLLFLSRIHPVKGLRILLEAWHRIREPGWDVVIAGPDEGGHRREIEALAQSLGLGSAVRFVGETRGPAKQALFESADLFVLPSHSENFGLVVAEALSCGLPVITTQRTPWAALARHDAGWWVPDTVEGIAAALCEATRASPGRRRQMGLHGRDYVGRELGAGHVAALADAAYAWVLAGTGAPPAHVQT
jgi:glycosyltransferase involved in cell wall biosynthesis